MENATKTVILKTFSLDDETVEALNVLKDNRISASALVRGAIKSAAKTIQDENLAHSCKEDIVKYRFKK